MSEKNFHQRLAAAMSVVSYVQKEKPKGMQYSIVSHDAVTAIVRPALLDAGIVYYPVRTTFTQNGNRTEVAMTVRFANIDKPDDFIDVETFGYGIDPSDKGPGKAMSYAVKYALLKTLGLETGDDPDLDQESRHKPLEVDASIAEYVSATLDQIQGDWENAAALKDWWNSTRQTNLRAALGIVNGTPAYTQLFNAYRTRGVAMATGSSIRSDAA